MLGGLVFFQTETTNGTGIVAYGSEEGPPRTITLAGASTWKYQDYRNIHTGTLLRSGLHFEYKAFGERLGPGIDYEKGYYCFDPLSDRIEWLSEEDDESYYFSAPDGRYLFFKEQSDLKRLRTLVVGSRIDAWSDPEKRDGKTMRVLKRFPTDSASLNSLDQMSPCGRYAFVRHAVPVRRKSGISGWENTYYIVDVFNGATKVLLKDDVARASGGWMSNVKWVADRQK